MTEENKEQQSEEIEIQITPLDEEKLLEQSFYVMMSNYQRNPANKKIAKYFANHFGDDFQWEDIPEDTKDPRLQAIAAEYLEEQLENIKNAAFSAEPDVFNTALRDLYVFAGLEYDLSRMSREDSDTVLQLRIGDMEELAKTHEVIKLGRDVITHLVSNEAGSVSRIEIENNVQKAEDLYVHGIINRGQMAKFYYNMAVLTERNSMVHSNTQQASVEQKQTYIYMKKALQLTSDINLIKICAEYLPDKNGNKMTLIGEACDRVLAQPDNDDNTLCKAHLLYAKSLITHDTSGILSGGNDNNREEAVYHYGEAYKYAGTQDGKAKILRKLSKIQKKIDPDGYLKTRLMLADNFLTGKMKIKEMIGLAAEINDKKAKTALLESAVNELVDSPSIKKEEKSLLLKNIGGKLRNLYTAEDAKRVAVLDKLEKKHLIKKKKEIPWQILRCSSKGTDYFS